MELQSGRVHKQHRQVISQRDRDDRVAGRQCEYREDTEEVFNQFENAETRRIGIVWHKVQRVQIA